ncbi:MAG: ABC transporter substrate-binding protein [Thiolinea sp.]
MVKLSKKIPVLGSLGAAAFLLSSSLNAATIAYACDTVGIQQKLCQEAADAFEKETGNKVELVSMPKTATEILSLYQQILAAGADDIDVYKIDVIWPGVLANHMIDLKPYMDGAEAEHFPAIVQNNTVDDKLVGMPFYTDAGVLYYRKDLLEKYEAEVPTTWAALTETAQKVQDGEREAGNADMHGFVWQGRAYEGLTCDAVEWVVSNNGGSIVEPDGTISINNAKASDMVDMAAKWVGSISPEGVLNYAEEEARGVFQAGNAVFMRNWPYAWALAQGDDSVIKDKVGVAALPKGGDDGRSAATLGGWQLSVSKYSKNPEVAAQFVKFLTSYENQKKRAIEGGYNPTIEKLYADEDVLKANPFFGELLDTFTSAAARPSTVTGSKYPEVSSAFFNAVHRVLSGDQSGSESFAQLERELKRTSRGGKW